jgi:hypothetical protein
MPLTKLQGYSILSNSLSRKRINTIKPRKTKTTPKISIEGRVPLLFTIGSPSKSKKKHTPDPSSIPAAITALHSAVETRSKLERNVPAGDFRTVTKLTQNISHNLSTYINDTYFPSDDGGYCKHGVSNGYLKLWEIYHHLDSAIFAKFTPKSTVLHICEFPGNWIKCTYQYILQHHRQLFPYTWFANSLNPHNPTIKKDFPGVLTDELGYLARYETQWLFGADNTGNITTSANIKHIAAHCKGKVALVTGDAGLNKNYDMVLLQKLEIAQMLTCLSTNAPGGSCIIKNFASSFHVPPAEMLANLHYATSIVATYKKYYGTIHICKPTTSNPHSSEYYIVATGFLGISTAILTRYYAQLDAFTLNMQFESAANNPDITAAIYAIYNLNATHINSLNDMLRNLKENPIKLKKMTAALRNAAIPIFDAWIATNQYISWAI